MLIYNNTLLDIELSGSIQTKYIKIIYLRRPSRRKFFSFSTCDYILDLNFRRTAQSRV